MEQLVKINPNVRLRDLAIISAHDAGTSTISEGRCFSSVSRTQNFDLYTQLEVGARHLDTRFAPHTKSREQHALRIQHGPHGGEDFYKMLDQVVLFLHRHPREFVVLEVKFEMKSNIPITPHHYKRLVEYLNKNFGHLAIDREDLESWFRVETVTLGHILDSPKRVLLLSDNYIFDSLKQDGRVQISEIHPLSDIEVSEWHNTGHYKTLFSKNNHYHKKNEAGLSRFQVSQLILTPKAGVKFVCGYLCCMDRFRLDQKMYTLLRKKRLERYVRSLGDNRNINFLMLDFIDYCPNLLRFIIGLNFNFTIKILHATYKELKGANKHFTVDITSSLASMVVRSNSIWILVWLKDLHIAVIEGWLNISLEVNGERVENIREKVKGSDEFLWNGLVYLHEREHSVHSAADKMNKLSAEVVREKLNLESINCYARPSYEGSLSPVQKISNFTTSTEADQ